MKRAGSLSAEFLLRRIATRRYKLLVKNSQAGFADRARSGQPLTRTPRMAMTSPRSLRWQVVQRSWEGVGSNASPKCDTRRSQSDGFVVIVLHRYVSLGSTMRNPLRG